MKTQLLFLFFIICSSYGQAQHICSRFNTSNNLRSAAASRSDTLDILHTHVNLDFTDFGSQILDAEADLLIKVKVDGLLNVDLDLLGLTVNSVSKDGQELTYTHNNELLSIDLESEANTNDEFELHIDYSGFAQMDNSNWGGFYWTNNYAYNLGVGFDANPHSFGRSWFPCIDNFVERCTFSFNVTTRAPKIAVANGIPEYYGQTDEEGISSNYWEIENEIPSYLASIAVGDYEIQISQYTSITDQEVPVYLIAPQNNLGQVNASFINLQSAFDSYEEFYGKYEWSKVGYVFVPFNSGAMEHATNITYPLSFADGGLSSETTMAHELAHHWWGDLVTCSTAEDMWINEGMASYSEALFTEQLYGDDAYYDWITDNHRNIVTNAHRRDSGYLPVSGIGHEDTYGMHVYNKGASVGHNLRTYMGNEAFKNACIGFMADYSFQDVSSEDMKSNFQTYTSENLTAFFDDWVYNPGFTDFSIENVAVTEIPDSQFEIDLTISQRLHEAPSYFSNMPVLLTLISESNQEQESIIYISGSETNTTVTSDFNPKHVILNRDYGITAGILAEEKIISEVGADNFSYSEFRSDIDEMNDGDSVWMRVECHLTGPHEVQPLPEYTISTDRFWRIRGDFPEQLVASGRIMLQGGQTSSYDFDKDFFESIDTDLFDEEDIKLLYRENAQSQWTEHESYEISSQGNTTDFSGRVDFQNLRAGDYVWAFRTGETNIDEIADLSIQVFPNPVEDLIHLKQASHKMTQYAIFDMSGKLLQQGNLASNNAIKCQSIAPGNYALQIYNDKNEILSLTSFIKN